MRLQKQTKIVCTIGPASNTPEMLGAMIDAGMDVCRLNFSHGTYEQHAAMIATIRASAAKAGRIIALLQDLQGPKIRVGSLPPEGIMLAQGQEVIFSTDSAAVLPRITVSHAGLHEDVKPGDSILLDDGLLEVKVTRVAVRDIVTEVVTGGLLTSHKGFNLPTASLSIPAITDKDKEDLIFGVGQGVDFIALSFVRNAKDVEELRELIGAAAVKGSPAYSGQAPIRIISKIEKHEALKNIDAIIEASDAIMVARGDLGIETPASAVPLHQKRIIRKCREAGKPVIVATQMLDSMIRNPRPTRAEVSDVANAVIDHTDAVMLSGESASGKYPLESVRAMADIVSETENSEFDDVVNCDIPHHGKHRTADDAVSSVAASLARDTSASCVIVVTTTGHGVHQVSRERPVLPVIAACHDARVLRQLALSWGVGPLAVPNGAPNAMITSAVVGLASKGAFAPGDSVITVTTALDGKEESLTGASVWKVA